MGRGMAQSGYQMCTAQDQSRGWINVIIVDGEKKYRGASTIFMMPLSSVKVWQYYTRSFDTFHNKINIINDIV